MKTFLLRPALKSLVAMVAATLWAGTSAIAADAPPIKVPSVETLAQFPAMSGVQFSPDGKHMLALESKGDDRHILVWDTSKLSAPPVVIGSNPKSQISRASFLKNDMLQVTMFQPYDARYDGVVKTFISKVWFTDLEGKAWTEPMAAKGGGQTDENLDHAFFNPVVLNRLLKDPDNVILESGSHGEGGRAIYRYNVHTKSAQRVMRLGDTDADVKINAEGQPWSKKRYESDTTGAYVAIDIRGADGTWSEHFRSYVKNRDVVDVVALGTTPGTAVVKSNVGHEFTGLYEYDIATRKTTATLFEHKYFNAENVLSVHDDESPDKDGYAGYTFEGYLGGDQYWVDPKIEAALHGVAQALGIKEIDQELVDVASGAKAHVRAYDGVSVRLMQYRGGEVPRYLIGVTGLSYPTEYYLLQGPKLQLLGKAYPDIDKRALGTAQFTYYKARDGLNIPAYLVTPNPALCGPGPYPTVIHPHGGPWARDEMTYDGSSWIPLLVSQCRVVMRPQYRGSEGWGRTLWLAGDREWGQKMQDDKGRRREVAGGTEDRRSEARGHVRLLVRRLRGLRGERASQRPVQVRHRGRRRVRHRPHLGRVLPQPVLQGRPGRHRARPQPADAGRQGPDPHHGLPRRPRHHGAADPVEAVRRQGPVRRQARGIPRAHRLRPRPRLEAFHDGGAAAADQRLLQQGLRRRRSLIDASAAPAASP